MSSKAVFKLLVFIEVCYVIISTSLSLLYYNDVINGEINRSIVRLLTLLVYIFFFKTINTKKSATHISVHNLLFICLSLVLLMLIPSIIQTSTFSSSMVNIIWFSSSFIVGFREELFYRGFIQQCLTKTKPVISSILITSAIFTSYHVIFFIWGQWFVLIQIFVWSLIIGVIYYKTENIIFVSLIHSVYDALPFISPFRISDLPSYYGLILAMLALLAILPIMIKRTET